ncbi:hypothetical protein B7463_g11653, partial [Scytalidium lignicola]
MEESLVLSRFDSLVKSGVVLHDDKQEIIEHVDEELKFHFILTSALAKKPTFQVLKALEEDNNKSNQPQRDGSDIDTRDFEIGKIGSTHFVAVNKFCFARPHLMILTSNGHRKQYEPLHENDIEVAWAALTAFNNDYAIFYNCGQDGGCSRLHKHMQLMPMPEDSFAAFLDSEDGKEPDIPFCWFYRRLESQHVTQANLTRIYTDLLKQATRVGKGLSQHAENTPPGAACPHNMILTKRWMIVLPRRRAGINKEAGANAMGMLGYIAVATQGEINKWVQLGPKEVLKQLGVFKKAH